jgi:hypothetical protein
MKRLAHVAALLFGGEAGVHADSDIYTNMLKQPAATTRCTPILRCAIRTREVVNEPNANAIDH